MKLKEFLLLSMIGSSVMAQDKLAAWQDPEVNEVKRMAAHADFMNKNEWRMSLHGMWGEMPMQNSGFSMQKVSTKWVGTDSSKF